MQDERKGFFERNKPVSFAIIIACMLFVFIFLLEKTKVIINFIPTFRGEVRLANNFVITTTKSGCPVIVRKDDPKAVGVRFSGEIASTFDKVIHNLYSNNSTIVEVGAHFGERTLEIANRVRKAGRVFAFEANQKVFEKLKKSIMLNDLDDVISVQNIGIYDSKCSINIRDNLSGSSGPNGKISGKRNLNVQCDTLDSAMSSFSGEIDLLVIDIPQSEFEILEGSKEIISRSPGIVILIAIDSESEESKIKKAWEKFKKQGFNFYRVNKDGTLFPIMLENVLELKELALVITKKDLPTHSNDDDES